MSKYIYLLRHTYEYGNENEHETSKNLGIYMTEEKANEAINRYQLLEGFRNYPPECFIIEEYLIDKDMWWTEGFIKWEEA